MVADGEGLSVADMDADGLSVGVTEGDGDKDGVKDAVRDVVDVYDGVIDAEAVLLGDAEEEPEGLAEVDALAVRDGVGDVLGVGDGDGDGQTAHSSALAVESLHTLASRRPATGLQAARRAVVEALHGCGQEATQWMSVLTASAPVPALVCHKTCRGTAAAAAAVGRACSVSHTGVSGASHVPTSPVSTAKSHTFLIAVSEIVVPAVRSVEPTRSAPVSS